LGLKITPLRLSAAMPKYVKDACTAIFGAPYEVANYAWDVKRQFPHGSMKQFIEVRALE
jgi:hypothetical protein